jgi:hypothetical protein
VLIGAGAVAACGVLALALLSAGGSDDTGTAAATAPGGGPARAAAPPRSPVTTTRTWNAGNGAYWAGNRRGSAAFELEAENTVPVWMRTVRPTLVVRCMARSTQVFVVTETAMKIESQTEDHTVTFSLDDQPEENERWPDSDEHDSLFAPDGAAFAKRLMQARAFRFRFTPHNADPVTAVFNVAGLAPHVESAARECGWK